MAKTELFIEDAPSKVKTMQWGGPSPILVASADIPTKQKAKQVAYTVPILGTVLAYNDYKKDPSVENGIGLGLSFIGDIGGIGGLTSVLKSAKAPKALKTVKINNIAKEIAETNTTKTAAKNTIVIEHPITDYNKTTKTALYGERPSKLTIREKLGVPKGTKVYTPEENVAFRQQINDFATKYGYEPIGTEVTDQEMLERYAKSLIKRHNTFYRGVNMPKKEHRSGIRQNLLQERIFLKKML